jgi:hypothetical protein
LEVALDRIGDAEDGAISLLDQNIELYNLSKSLEHDIALLQRQQKTQWIGATVTILGSGVGGALLGAGLNNVIRGGDTVSLQRDGTLIGTGVATIGITWFVWFAGHKWLKWW